MTGVFRWYTTCFYLSSNPGKKSSGDSKNTPATQKKADTKTADASTKKKSEPDKKETSTKTTEPVDTDEEKSDEVDEVNSEGEIDENFEFGTELSDYPSKIAGTWAIDCQAIFDEQNNEIGSINKTIVLTETTFAISENVYSDENCKTIASEQKDSGTFMLGSKDASSGKRPTAIDPFYIYKKN